MCLLKLPASLPKRKKNIGMNHQFESELCSLHDAFLLLTLKNTDFWHQSYKTSGYQHKKTRTEIPVDWYQKASMGHRINFAIKRVNSTLPNSIWRYEMHSFLCVFQPCSMTTVTCDWWVFLCLNTSLSITVNTITTITGRYFALHVAYPSTG